MFEPLENPQDAPLRLRRLAAGIAAVSVVLFVGLAIYWYAQPTSEFDIWGRDFATQGEVESGLAGASLLGGVLAFVLYWRSQVKADQLHRSDD